MRPILAALIGLLLTACDSGRPPSQAGEPLRPFEAVTTAGTTLRLPDDAAGKVVALRFWATWCPYCKSEMRAIEPVWRDLRDEGLLILAANVGQSRDTVAAFAAGQGIGYPVLVDEPARIAGLYGVTALPTTVLIDRTGTVRGKILGEADAADFRRAVLELLR